MNANARDFYCGFAAALASLAREHGQPSIAVDIMRCNGVSLADLQEAGVEGFDLQPLRDEWFHKYRDARGAALRWGVQDRSSDKQPISSVRSIRMR